MSRSRIHPPQPPVKEDVLQCDGTAQDYRRHSYRGEEPCAESREAWRVQCRMYRYTGVYDTFSTEDPTQVHPFMYRKPKRQNFKRDGTRPGRSKGAS